MKIEENFSKKSHSIVIHLLSNNIIFKRIDNIFITFIKLYATI